MRISLRWLFVAVPVVPIVGALLMAFFLFAPPTQEANACLPCDCGHTRSLNCVGPFLAYTQGTPNACSIYVFKMNPDGSLPLVFEIGPAQLNQLPANPAQNTLIATYYEFNLYKLQSGQYQLNVGPDMENKVHILQIDGCPASTIAEGTYVQGVEGSYSLSDPRPVYANVIDPANIAAGQTPLGNASVPAAEVSSAPTTSSAPVSQPNTVTYAQSIAPSNPSNDPAYAAPILGGSSTAPSAATELVYD